MRKEGEGEGREVRRERDKRGARKEGNERGELGEKHGDGRGVEMGEG